MPQLRAAVAVDFAFRFVFVLQDLCREPVSALYVNALQPIVDTMPVKAGIHVD